MFDWSSTMRMLCMLAGRNRPDGFDGKWQFDHKPGADRLVLLHPNGAMMIFHDAAHNGQPQSRAPLLGGEVRQKEPLLQFLSDAVAGVGNAELDSIAAGDERSGDGDFA